MMPQDHMIARGTRAGRVLRLLAERARRLEADEGEDREHHADDDAAGRRPLERELVGVDDPAVVHVDGDAQDQDDRHRDGLEDERDPLRDLDVRHRHDGRGQAAHDVEDAPDDVVGRRHDAEPDEEVVAVDLEADARRRSR